MGFDLGVYMAPYWLGRQVCYEAVMVVEEKDGFVPDIPLLYGATEILQVRSSDHSLLYTPGVDYALVDGKLRILPGSRIPRMDYDTYYPKTQVELSKPHSSGQGYIYFSEGSLLHDRQIAVSYRHEGHWQGMVPPCKAALLPKTQARIGAGSLKLCVLGDSICVGGNSSGFLGVAPMAPIWAEMVKLQLESRGVTVAFQNPSLGGKTSAWGAEVAPAALAHGPELCIIGFGMNDGSKRVEPAEYAQNIRTMMDAARAANPDCEFLLVATTLPNGQVGRFLGYQEDYLPVLQAMEQTGVAVADMTGFHKTLLARKRFYDMTGTNVNHPNDFLARAYAQVVWQTLVGYEKDR